MKDGLKFILTLLGIGVVSYVIQSAIASTGQANIGLVVIIAIGVSLVQLYVVGKRGEAIGDGAGVHVVISILNGFLLFVGIGLLTGLIQTIYLAVKKTKQ